MLTPTPEGGSLPRGVVRGTRGVVRETRGVVRESRGVVGDPARGL